MKVEILTKEDLDDFRKQLLSDFREMLSQSGAEPKKWIKSQKVREIMKVSSGTLQNLRENGSLPFNKIGGTIYYKYEDIQKLMDGKMPKRR